MKKYIINLLGYVGVGFVGGSISHGFFTGTRSFVMAALGIAIFLIAEFLKEGEKNYTETIIFGLSYSLCVGMISGGFTHFLDSPDRSIIIIPIGFVLGYIIFAYKNHELNSKALLNSSLIGLALFGLGYGARRSLPASIYSDIGQEDHHSNTNTNGSSTVGTSKVQKASWMMGKTDEAIAEHCKMMPSMEGCSTTDTAMNHTMNHADMVQSEFDFVYLMVPHHQEAVDSSKLLLQTTQNPALITLANDIIGAQNTEITMMSGRLGTIYSGDIYTGMGYMAMMRPSAGLDTHQIDKQWTQDMIKHHQGALDMANKLLEIFAKTDPLIRLTPEGSKHREELRAFAQNIISSQTKEIQMMKNIIGEIKEGSHDH